MNKATSLLFAGAMGAGLAFLLDPERGRRRRLLLRDRARRIVADTEKAADVAWRDSRNRLYGAFAELKSSLTTAPVSDDVLVARVRSKLGHYVSHPSSIEVHATDGNVTLRGPILGHEVDD